jgi:hypothetical protein
MAQGARHMAQGKNNQMKFILSLSFMPCASSAGKAIQLLEISFAKTMVARKAGRL